MLNNVTVCGRICNDLELKQTPNGVFVLSFTIACERDFKDKNGERQTDFIDVITFNHTAEFVSRYFSKGRMAIVDGRLQTRRWQDKKGNNRKAVEIVSDSVYFADSKTDVQTQKTQNNGNSEPVAAIPAQSDLNVDLCDSDLPF